MIYTAFSVYLLGILFAAMAVYRLWADLVKPRWVNWALLPGTLVSEMAFIFGSLITGGEVRRAKLMGGKEDAGRESRWHKESKADAEPTVETAPKLRFFGPVVAAFVSLLACGAGIVLAHVLLGKPVINQFASDLDTYALTARLKQLPRNTGQFWDQLKYQLDLLRRMAETWRELNWLNWCVPLFVYLATCLAIRLAPVGRPLRATLVAMVAAVGNIALIGLIWKRFYGVMDDIWPLVMYVWASLLFLLAVSLVIRGALGLVHALLEKQGEPKRAAA
jgi:hypothetical protein